jgi:hypothetical protein
VKGRFKNAPCCMARIAILAGCRLDHVSFPRGWPRTRDSRRACSLVASPHVAPNPICSGAAAVVDRRCDACVALPGGTGFHPSTNRGGQTRRACFDSASKYGTPASIGANRRDSKHSGAMWNSREVIRPGGSPASFQRMEGRPDRRVSQFARHFLPVAPLDMARGDARCICDPGLRPDGGGPLAPRRPCQASRRAMPPRR